MTYRTTTAPLLPRPAAKPAHPAQLAPNITAAWRGIKCTACLMGCLFCLLAAMMFYGAMVEGLSSWSASLVLCGLCVWMCRTLYRLAEGEERHQRRMHGKTERRRRLRRWLRRFRL